MVQRATNLCDKNSHAGKIEILFLNIFIWVMKLSVLLWVFKYSNTKDSHICLCCRMLIQHCYCVQFCCRWLSISSQYPVGSELVITDMYDTKLNPCLEVNSCVCGDVLNWSLTNVYQYIIFCPKHRFEAVCKNYPKWNVKKDIFYNEYILYW